MRNHSWPDRAVASTSALSRKLDAINRVRFDGAAGFRRIGLPKQLRAFYYDRPPGRACYELRPRSPFPLGRRTKAIRSPDRRSFVLSLVAGRAGDGLLAHSLRSQEGDDRSPASGVTSKRAEPPRSQRIQADGSRCVRQRVIRSLHRCVTAAQAPQSAESAPAYASRA